MKNRKSNNVSWWDIFYHMYFISKYFSSYVKISFLPPKEKKILCKKPKSKCSFDNKMEKDTKTFNLCEKLENHLSDAVRLQLILILTSGCPSIILYICGKLLFTKKNFLWNKQKSKVTSSRHITQLTSQLLTKIYYFSYHFKLFSNFLHN